MKGKKKIAKELRSEEEFKKLFNKKILKSEIRDRTDLSDSFENRVLEVGISEIAKQCIRMHDEEKETESQAPIEPAKSYEEIFLTRDDIKHLQDATIYIISNFNSTNPVTNIKAEGIELVFQLKNGKYVSLLIIEDGTSFLSGEF